MNFETDYTDEITCPYCGYEEGDSWEYGDLESTGRVSCGSCGKEFWATRNVAITYSTEKVDWKLDGEKKIDRCANCSCFEKILIDFDGFKDFKKRCMKSDRSILVDENDNIERFCELESVEADDE